MSVDGDLDFLPSPGIDRLDVVAALASALLLNLAGPPGIGLLVFPALVPFLLRWARRRRLASLRWSASFGALLFTLWWAIELLWVLRIVRVALWPIPAYVGQVAALGLIGALFGVALHGGRRAPLFVTAPLAWAGVEVLRSDHLGPLDFAWSPLALPLVDALPLLQPAAWVGETGVGAAVVGVSGLVAAGLYRTTEWWTAGSGGRDPAVRGGGVVPMAAAVLVVAGWWWQGTARLDGLEARPVATLVALQPGIPLAARRDTARAVPESRAAIESLLDAAVAAGPGEIVLPETALPMDLDGEEARQIVAEWVERTRRPIWVGGFRGTEDGGIRNVLVRFDRSGPTGAWAKVALVPGVEAGPGSDYRPGPEGQLPIAFDGGPEGDEAAPVGVLICIEATREGLVREHAAGGARWILNVTNDAWLAEDPVSTRTLAFETHPAHLQLRALESGLGALRVGNNGRTGTVDPAGRWTEVIPAHIAGVRSTRVESLSAPTPWVRWGGAMRWGALAGLGLLLLTAARGAVPDPTAR